MENTERLTLDQLKAGIVTITPGWRFLHWLIDCLIIGAIASVINNFLPFDFNVGIVIFPLYYILFEYFLQRTPGKYVTKTMVINNFGEHPAIQTILLRTLIRYIPIEAFSCLGDNSRGWHDSWSKTYVIKEAYLPRIIERLEQIKSPTIES